MGVVTFVADYSVRLNIRDLCKGLANSFQNQVVNLFHSVVKVK